MNPRKVMVWKHFQSAKTAVQINKHNARVKVNEYFKVFFTESLGLGLGRQRLIEQPVLTLTEA